MLLAMIFSLLVLNDNWQMAGPHVGDNPGVQVLSPSEDGKLNFKWRNSSGEWTELASLRGQVVYINFWASWCEPCKRELPIIESLQKKWGKNKLVVLLVNLDHGKELQDFAKQMQLKLAPSTLNIYEGGKILEDFFELKVLPAHILIDQNGRVSYRVNGELNRQLQDLEKTITTLSNTGVTKEKIK